MKNHLLYLFFVIFGVMSVAAQNKVYSAQVGVDIQYGRISKNCTGIGICGIILSGNPNTKNRLMAANSGEIILRMNKAELIDAFKGNSEIENNRFAIQEEYQFPPAVFQKLKKEAPYIGETEKNLLLKKGNYTLRQEGENVIMSIKN